MPNLKGIGGEGLHPVVRFRAYFFENSSQKEYWVHCKGLIDSGASHTSIPRRLVEKVEKENGITPHQFYFPVTVSTAENGPREEDMPFCIASLKLSKSLCLTELPLPIIEGDHFIIGMNILKYFTLIIDGPSQQWSLKNL